MVYSTLKDAAVYAPLSKGIKMALDFLTLTDLTQLEDGRHPIDGDDVYALLQSYTTHSYNAARLECHQAYIDLQYVFEGSEQVYVGLLDGTHRLMEEALEKDYALYKGDATPLLLGDGRFLLLWPQDLHAPGVTAEQPQQVRKVVVKIKIDFS